MTESTCSGSTASSADADRVIIFDTTLRDGEQSPGASMTTADKLRIAAALHQLGVDVIEAGFPAASPGDFAAVQQIARQVQGPTIAALARCTASDIRRAADAVQDAAHRRLHVFLATSAIHREFKLQMARGEIVRRTREGVAAARVLVDDVEFSPEDASRTEPDFLAEVIEAAIEAGATTINIPDTVGYAMPRPYADLFRWLRENVRGLDGERVVLSAHCHDDLGMAVANSLAAVEAGARQVECTINGIGERAGNASLEEIVMALRTRADHFAPVHTRIETRQLLATSRLVSEVTRLPMARHKAVVGRNAFAHEAGIHQHGVLANRETYEIMRPEDVGFASNELPLGKHSGRHALRARLERLGHDMDDARLDRVFGAFKRLADTCKEEGDDDLQTLMINLMSAAGSGRQNRSAN